MPNKSNTPVGEFEESGVKIQIFAKKDETPDQAIDRVTKRHDVPVRAVKKLTKKEDSKEEKQDG